MQSYSKIDRIVNFHVDMSKSKSKQVEPEQSILDEIQHIMRSISNSNNSNNTSISNTTIPMTTTTTTDTSILLESDEILNAATAGLLDLDGGVVTQDEDYYCEQQHSNINSRQHNMQQTNNFARNMSQNEDSSSDIDNDD